MTFLLHYNIPKRISPKQRGRRVRVQLGQLVLVATLSAQHSRAAPVGSTCSLTRKAVPALTPPWSRAQRGAVGGGGAHPPPASQLGSEATSVQARLPLPPTRPRCTGILGTFLQAHRFLPTWGGDAGPEGYRLGFQLSPITSLPASINQPLQTFTSSLISRGDEMPKREGCWNE